MYFVTAQDNLEFPAEGEMLPPLQHFVPPTAVWRRPVSLGACRNKHLSLVHNSKHRELFHYGLSARGSCPAHGLPCCWGMGEERKAKAATSHLGSIATGLPRHVVPLSSVQQIHPQHTEHQLLSTDNSQVMLRTPLPAEEQDQWGLSHRSVNWVECSLCSFPVTNCNPLLAINLRGLPKREVKTNQQTKVFLYKYSICIYWRNTVNYSESSQGKSN